MSLTSRGAGAALQFLEWGINITASQASRNFFWCTPTYAILGVQQLEPIGQHCYNILLVVLVH